MAKTRDKVKTFRMLCGKTQEEMAAVIGVSTHTYRLKECGERSFTEHEMTAFLREVQRTNPEASLDEIFLP